MPTISPKSSELWPFAICSIPKYRAPSGVNPCASDTTDNRPRSVRPKALCSLKERMTIFTDFRKLGSGGFSEVWLCKRKDDGKVFAKKKLLPSLGEDSIRRFREEVRLLHSLDH